MCASLHLIGAGHGALNPKGPQALPATGVAALCCIELIAGFPASSSSGGFSFCCRVDLPRPTVPLARSALDEAFVAPTKAGIFARIQLCLW